MILRLYNKVRLQWLQVGDKVEIEVYGNTFHSFNDIPFVELVHRCEGEVTIHQGKKVIHLDGEVLEDEELFKVLGIVESGQLHWKAI